MEIKKAAKLPTFLVVGAGKTGTSWLRVSLQEHPEVFIPGKEIHFFSEHYQNGFEWYEEFFATAERGVTIGDISPSYMFSLEAHKRIYGWEPSTKIIFSLRNPIDRAYSHYKMGYRFGRVKGDIDKELAFNTQMVKQGLYTAHIERYLTLFPKPQVKVLIYDDLKQNPLQYLQDVLSFIEVDKNFSPSTLQRGFHVTKGKPKHQNIHKMLLYILKKMTHTNNFTRAWAINLRKSNLTKFYNRINPGAPPPALSHVKLRELAMFYSEDVKKLSDLLNRDLNFWITPYLS